MSETPTFDDGDELPEISWQASQAIESWRRILEHTAGDKTSNFERGAAELTGLAAQEPASRAAIIDSLYFMGQAAGLSDDETQGIIARVESARRVKMDDAEIARLINGPRERANNDGAAFDQPPPATGPEDCGSANAEAAEELPELDFVDSAEWEGQPVPPRQWLAPQRIPLANVTMLYGDGAAGKTTIALQLAVAVRAESVNWFGSIIDKPGPVIFLTGEEDSDEMHRRLAAIVEHHNIRFRDLAGLRLLCLPGKNTVLGTPDRSGVIQPTPLFGSLCASAATLQPSLIVLEAAADVFAGNENDRAQVRQFVALLRHLAVDTGAAVLLIAHPSLTGLASGSGTSGSTAWNNSVRSRLYFTGAKKADDDAESDIRELKVMKSNYGPAGEIVRLRWQRGVFVPEGGPGMFERIAAEAAVEQAYLDCLDATHGSGRQVGPYAGKAYAPAIFEKMPQAKGYRAKALATAQERLFNAGRIEVVKVGPPSKALDRIFRKAAP